MNNKDWESWGATGDPLSSRIVREYEGRVEYVHPLRQLYRDALSNTIRLQSIVLAACLLFIMFWATRLFLRLVFAIIDAWERWRSGGRIVLAPFESERYWEHEYARHPEDFEWYAEYKDVRDLIVPLVSPRDKVLHVGCGTSNVGLYLQRDTGAQVMNIDVSGNALELAKGAARRVATPHNTMQFKRADVRQLPAAWAATYSMVIDKGTLDALSCSRDDGEGNVQRMLDEVHRVLLPDGVLVLVTTVKAGEVRRWLAAARFDIVNVAHLVTTMSQRRVPVLPNDVYVVRKRHGSRQVARHDDGDAQQTRQRRRGTRR